MSPEEKQAAIIQLAASINAEARKAQPNVKLMNRAFHRLKVLASKDRAWRLMTGLAKARIDPTWNPDNHQPVIWQTQSGRYQRPPAARLKNPNRQHSRRQW